MREHRLRIETYTLALLDGLAVLASFALAYYLRFYSGIGGLLPVGEFFAAQYVTFSVVVVVTWLVLFRESGLYRDVHEGGTEEFFRICGAVVLGMLLLAGIGFFYRGFSYSRGFVVAFVPLNIVVLKLCRSAYRRTLRWAARRGVWVSPVLIVGAGQPGERLAAAINERGTSRAIGYVDDPPPQAAADKAEAGPAERSCERLGGIEDLARILSERRVEEVLIAKPHASREELAAVVEECYRCHVRWRLVPDVYELMLEHMDLSLVGDIPLLGTRGSRIVGLNFVIKRIFDIAVSLSLLALLAPLMTAIALAIKLTSSGPVFFSQERVGYRGRRFRFLKFRSMRQDAPSDDHRDYVRQYISGRAQLSDDGQFKLAEDPRVTAVGSLIRKFSVDELPQLFNVLKGDMSLIGPRPPVPYEVEAYEPRHLRRLEVLPGISGLWQVSGRNRLTFEEMVRLDIYYIENWSLGLDIRIFFKTIPVVVFSRAH